MMHSTNGLYGMLQDNLAQINSQIAATTERTEKQIAALPYPDGVTVYQMQDRNGRGVLTDLLVAKAQILSGMANLKAADASSKAPSPRERRR